MGSEVVDLVRREPRRGAYLVVLRPDDLEYARLAQSTVTFVYAEDGHRMNVVPVLRRERVQSGNGRVAWVEDEFVV